MRYNWLTFSLSHARHRASTWPAV